MKGVFFFRQKNAKYSHITDEEIQKAEQAVRQSFQWLEQVRNKTVNAPKHMPPPVTVQQIRQEKANFENIVNPIINKPPPKAPTPPKEDSGDNKAQQPQDHQNQTQQDQQQQQDQPQQQSQGQENMEWQAA